MHYQPYKKAPDEQASFERAHKLRNGELGGLILVLDYNVER